MVGRIGAGVAALACPGSTEVDLWWVRVPLGTDVVPDSSSVLTDHERERLGRFKDISSRLRYLTGRVALRRLLATYLGEDPSGIPIVLGPSGKPSLGDVGSSELTFNLSHSGEWVLLAFGSGAPVGVDVESVAGFPRLEEVAARVLTADELAELQALPEGARIEAFFRAWTRKEALLKALGTGLGGATADLPTGLGTAGPSGSSEVVVRPLDQHRDWSVTGVEAPDGYCAAVAKAGSPLRIRSTGTRTVLAP